MKITKSDFEAWWNFPVGLEFRKMVREDMDKLAHGSMVESFARDTTANAVMVGEYKALLFIYNLVYEQLMGE